MIAYAIRRLLFLPLVFLAISLMVFSLQMLLTPTQRIAAYAPGPEYLKGGAEQVEMLIVKYGLDDPFVVQYGRWVENIFQGQLGWSETARMPVGEALFALLPATAELALLAFIPGLFLAIWLGTKSAVHHNKSIDHAIRVFTILGWSFPTFVFGLLMLMIFYGAVNWFPPGRLSQWAILEISTTNFVRYTGMNTVDSILNGNWRIFLDSIRHLVAPVVTLIYVNVASMTRIMRSSMLETLRQDYVRTARAKGVHEQIVRHKHARRNALLPVVTIAGMEIAFMMGGVVIAETVFDYRGLGQFAAQAAAQLDFPAVLGFALYFALLLVFANLVVDLLYVRLDPRVKLR